MRKKFPQAKLWVGDQALVCIAVLLKFRLVSLCCSCLAISSLQFKLDLVLLLPGFTHSIACNLGYMHSHSALGRLIFFHHVNSEYHNLRQPVLAC
ncbi:hypothetical protein B9Z19DRAFT_1085072 [Tuber borchii]|uniref:Uncharacterized protein n=1 Tax=Tuber borchii TaxID=42251 RepID=A0A2T6ZR85_TUBBO|nr:hypothetical protein B9Z19DRAFT_1085072 [Tuber borchii]